MMIEQHYDEEVLIALLDDPGADPHLQACDTCKSALHSIRQVTSALHDDTVWDRRELSEEPKAATRDALRFAATSVAAEDAAAEPWVKSLLAKSSTEWASIVAAHPEWKTAGFVRRLIVAVDAINFTAPTDAVELMRIAVEVAEALPVTGDRVAKLRGKSLREYGYALYYVGSYANALVVLDESEKSLQATAVRDYDSARAAQTKSYVLSAMERFDEALNVAADAKRTFMEFGDARRALALDMLAGTVLIRTKRFEEALRIHQAIASSPDADVVLRANAMNNAAICHREQGNLREAKQLLGQVIPEFERLGAITYRTAARWQLGSILLAENSFEKALKIFEMVRDEYRELGKADNLALVYVDMAEALLMLDRPLAVSQVCEAAIDYFKAANLTYTSAALTALAYLREAAETQALTVAAISDVRSFFEVMPQQPQLLFARPS